MADKYFKLEGKEELIKQLRNISADVEDGVSLTLKAVGERTRNEIRSRIQEGNGFPSEPGSAPHSQSGNLLSAIYHKLDEKILGKEILLTVGVRFRAYYAFILEHGAANYKSTPFGFSRKHKLGEGAKNQARFGARLLPRPFFWPTIEDFWARTPIEVENSVNKVLKSYAS